MPKRKHAEAWSQNILLPRNFVYRQAPVPPEEQNPPPRERQEGAETDATKLERAIRDSVAETLAERGERRAPAASADPDIRNVITKKLRDTLNADLVDINVLLRYQGDRITKKRNLETAMKKLGTVLGIPTPVQKAILFEMDTNSNADTHIKNLDTFLENIVGSFVAEYSDFIAIAEMIQEDPNLYEKATRAGETPGTERKHQLARIKKRILDKIQQKSQPEYTEILTKLKNTIKQATDQLVEKACDTFGVGTDTPVRTIFKDDEEMRTKIITHYGELKEKEWEDALIEKDKATAEFETLEAQKILKKDQEEIKEEMKYEKMRAKLTAAIKIYDLNNLDIGFNEGLGIRLTRDFQIVEASRKKIKGGKIQLENKEKELSMKRKEAEQTQIRNEIADINKGIENEEKNILMYGKVIEWALERYAPEDSSKEEYERKQRGKEVQKELRKEAANYLIEKGDWLNDKFYGENSDFTENDKEKIKNMLLGEGEQANIFTDKQVLDFCEKQIRYNETKEGSHPFQDFTAMVRSECEKTASPLMAQFLAENEFYEDFIKKHLGNSVPQNADSITEEKLQEFFRGLFGLAISGESDKKGKAKFEKMRDVTLKFLGGADGRKKYYSQNELGPDKFGKDDNNSNRPTIARKGREMMCDLLKTYATEGRFKAKESMDEIVERDWSKGMYPCIARYSKEAREIGAGEDEKKEDGDQKPQGFFSKAMTEFFGKTNWLSWYAVTEMFQTGFEGVKRSINLKTSRKAAEAGIELSKYMPYWGKELRSEFFKVRQSKENEEVTSRKGNYDQFGYGDLLDELHKAPNQFTIKAVLITLAEKGYLRRNDLVDKKAIAIFNKVLGAGIPIPKEDPDDMEIAKKTGIINSLRDIFDPLWGQGTLDGWFAQSDSARESNTQKNFSISQKLSSNEKMRNFNDMLQLLFQDKEAFIRKYPIDVILGYIRQDIVEGKLDCDWHITVLTILRMEGIIDDEHVEEFRTKHSNDYPSYAILRKDEMIHCGMAKQYEDAKETGLFKDGKLNEKHEFMKFFINRSKLKLKARQKGNFWEIATSKEEAIDDKNFKWVSIFASDLHQRRSAHLQYVDNSNAPVYFRSYSVEELKSSVLHIGTNGKMDKVDRGHDLTAMLAGSFFTPIFADMIAAKKAVESGDGKNFMNQVRMAYHDVYSTYKMIYYLTQHAQRTVPKEMDKETGIPKKGSQKGTEQSHVQDTENIYYQSIGGAKTNRLKQPAVIKVAEDFQEMEPKILGKKFRETIDGLIGLKYVMSHKGDQKMLGFEPWTYLHTAFETMDQYFKEIGGKMYDPESAKSLLTGEKGKQE